MSRQVFVITVTGEMDQSLRDEFADVGITVDHSVTRLRLVSADPSALHGLLNRIAGARTGAARRPPGRGRITRRVVRRPHPTCA